MGCPGPQRALAATEELQADRDGAATQVIELKRMLEALEGEVETARAETQSHVKELQMSNQKASTALAEANDAVLLHQTETRTLKRVRMRNCQKVCTLFETDVCRESRK